jgi:hypothetical protein
LELASFDSFLSFIIFLHLKFRLAFSGALDFGISCSSFSFNSLLPVIYHFYSSPRSLVNSSKIFLVFYSISLRI